MNIDEIINLIEKISESNITSIDLTLSNNHVFISKTVPNHEQNNEAISDLNNNKIKKVTSTEIHKPKKEDVEIKSPMVGIVYLQEKPDKPAYKKVGDNIQKGEVVCLIEAMKTVSEVKSKVSGTIEKVLVSNEQMVEYNQPLFKVRQD